MSSKPSESSVVLSLEWPRVIVLAACLVLVLVAAGALQLPLPPPGGPVTALLAVIAGGSSLVRWVYSRPVALEIGRGGRVGMHLACGGRQRARLRRAPRVLPAFIALSLDRRTSAGKYLVITPDMTGDVDYRRLSRLLRTMNPA